jgi:hypothetical protein
MTWKQWLLVLVLIAGGTVLQFHKAWGDETPPPDTFFGRAAVMGAGDVLSIASEEHGPILVRLWGVSGAGPTTLAAHHAQAFLSGFLTGATSEGAPLIFCKRMKVQREEGAAIARCMITLHGRAFDLGALLVCYGYATDRPMVSGGYYGNVRQDCLKAKDRLF